MRARAGDPPRTMTQRILAPRAGGDAALSRDFVDVDVDQVVLARAPARALGEAIAAGLKRTTVEVAVAYDGRCIADARSPDDTRSASVEMLAHNVLVARPGAGFPAPVHVERFASPARLCVTDEPRLAGVGGAGMLSLVVPTSSLARALTEGKVLVRPPVSIEVLIQGRLRPFVCARDVAFELLRRGLADLVRNVENARGAPVVLEFSGPSVRSLSVAERSVLAGVGPLLGAAGAIFVSDERTEVFLRDQRRSKAHRALSPDAGASFEETTSIDLGAVDPLLMDERGEVRAVRDLAGQPVVQAVLGGDGGVTLRDLLAVAVLLKSKRVPSRLDFLLAVPSRQMLEVLSSTGALTDLIATGGRLLEPDTRVVTGGLYPPPPSGLTLRTFDAEPGITRAQTERRSVVVSAETLAYAVATGEVGDPRAFKRPVRVTVPRTLPTDDVLVARKAERSDGTGRRAEPARAVLRREAPDAFLAWPSGQKLALVPFEKLDAHLDGGADPRAPVAAICETLEQVRDLASRAAEVAPRVRAVLAPFIPSGMVALFSAARMAALRVEADGAAVPSSVGTIALPAAAQWAERKPMVVPAGSGGLRITWLALGAERDWAAGGLRAEPEARAVRR